MRKMREEGSEPESMHQQGFRKNKCFDGSIPNRCLSWLEQIHTMSNNYNRDYHEELLLKWWQCYQDNPQH